MLRAEGYRKSGMGEISVAKGWRMLPRGMVPTQTADLDFVNIEA